MLNEFFFVMKIVIKLLIILLLKYFYFLELLELFLFVYWLVNWNVIWYSLIKRLVGFVFG